MILIDTNVVVDYLRGHPPAVAFFKELDIESAAVSAISEAELLAGTANKDQKIRSTLIAFLGPFQCLGVDHFTGVLAGDVSREHGLEIPDAVIAAAALLSKATLVTRNVKDFERVPGIKIKKPY